MTPLRLAYLSLVRRRVSSLIAIFAIAVSVACSGLLLKLYLLSGSRFDSLASGGQAIVGAKAGGIEILLGSLNSEGDYPSFIPDKLFLSLRHQAPVAFEDGVVSKPTFLRSVIPILFFAKFKGSRVIGTDESFFHRPDPEDSLEFAEGQFERTGKTLVVGSAVAAREGLKVGDSLSVQSWTGDGASQPLSDFRITGVLRETGTVWDRSLFSSIETAQASLAKSSLESRSIWGTQVLHYFFAYLNPNGFKDLSALINKRTVAQAVLVDQEKKRLEDLTGTGRTLGLVVVVFILILGGLSIAGLLTTRFEAMTVQIAVLRAIGYSRSEMSRWLLFEGLLLGGVACAIGGLLDVSLFSLLRQALGSALPPSELQPLSPLASYPIWVASSGATVLAVFIPLWNVFRQDVHSSLRGL